MSVADKWTQAFFNATCPRTAGFTSVDLASLGVQSVLVYIFLMWVGGAAQSTAGGIKVNAFAVVVLNLVAVLRGTERVEVFGRELSYDSILPFQCDGSDVYQCFVCICVYSDNLGTSGICHGTSV